MDIRELEAQFEQIDEQSEDGTVNVSLEGDTESSGNLKVSVTSRERRFDPAEASEVSDSTSLQTETLVDVDLREVDVPNEYINGKIRAALATGTSKLPSPILKQIEPTENWELWEDYSYPAAPGPTTEFTITALKGFVFDRASVPAIVWVITKDSLGIVGPLFHDLLYRNGGVLPQSESQPYEKYGTVTPARTFSRKDTDELFRVLALKSGVKKWRAEAAYKAVRTFGGLSAWKG